MIRSEDFVNSEGVNTHVEYNDGGYANVQNIIRYLQYLGITHVRDGLNTPGQFGSPSIAAYETVAQAGIKFTLFISGSMTATGGTPTDPSLDMRIGYIDQLMTAVPGSVVAVEGANEINNWPVTYNGQGGTGAAELNAAVALQQAIYSGVHADPVLAGVTVDDFTGYGAGTIPEGPDPATTAGLADADTQHPYPNGGQAPAYWVSRSTTLGNETAADAAAGAPVVYTETGYSSIPSTSGGVNPDVQAKYTLDLFLDAAKDGVASTDLYELMDAYAPGSPQGDAGWGLFDDTGAAKPVATAIHNMNAILSDSAANATSFTTTSLAATITGGSSTGNDLIMQKADGSYVIALWDEQSIWNATTMTETEAVAHNVTVTLSGVGDAAIAEYDPMLGTNAIASFAGTSATVSVSDHPVFLLVTPNAINAPPTLTGAVAGQPTTDNKPLAPFAGMTVADVDAGGTDSLTILLQDDAGTPTDANGTLSGSGLVKTATGSYSLATTSPDALTAELRALTFTPTRDQVAVGQTVTTGFIVTASQTLNGTTTTAASTSTTVVTTAYNVADGNLDVTGGPDDVVRLGNGQDDVFLAGWGNRVTLGDGQDSVASGSGGDGVTVGGGNDLIMLTGYCNTVQGGGGRDTISGTGGGLVVLGNGADDVSLGGYSNNLVLGDGRDTVRPGAGAASVSLGGGADLVTLAGYANTVTGGGGSDMISGSQGSTVILGGGSDTVIGSGSNNSVSLGGGSDLVQLSGWNNSVSVGDGNDTIDAGAGVSHIVLGTGSDNVQAGSNAMVMAGAGNDTIGLTGYASSVTVSGGNDTILGGTGDTISASAAHLLLSGTNNAMVFLAAGTSSAIDQGSHITFVVGLTTGAVSLSGLARDPAFVVDLKGQVGNYLSLQDVLASLRSDGSGGTTLNLGGSNVIDFVGMTSASLTAAHFRIG